MINTIGNTNTCMIFYGDVYQINNQHGASSLPKEPAFQSKQMMHGSLIDSHHRSSLSSTGPGALSSSEHTLTDDEHTNKPSNINHPIISSPNFHLKKAPVSLDDVDEDDDNEKEPTISDPHSVDFFSWTHGHRQVMLTFCTICVFAFMTGVEYAVILPTAFDYVKTMTNADIYVGLVLSFYSISGSIAGIIMGKISDMTGKVKLLILIAAVFEIGGDILYFVGTNIHIVLLGRLVAGVGMGAVPPILADVAHRTTENDRTKAISIILGCRQFGLMIGPCFTLLIRLMNFHIGSIHVNNLNGPGFLMAIVWVALIIVCWFCFHDRARSSPNEFQQQKYSKSDHSLRPDEQGVPFRTYRAQYIRIEMIVLFLATFITYFNQTALETIVAAFTERHFKWTTMHTSVLFASAGLEIIIVYILLVKIFSKRFEDRMLLILGFISLTLACILGTFFTWGFYSFGWFGNSDTSVVNNRLLSMFIVFVFLDLLGLPFIAATSVSLFTKLTTKDLQGVSQGIQRSVMGVGTIVGPLFASLLLNRLHIMMTTMLTLTALTLIAILIVVKRLRPSIPKVLSNDTKSVRNPSSSLEDNNDQSAPALALSSKNCYVTLVQHDDEQHDDSLDQTSKHLSNNHNCANSEVPNPSFRYDTSSTNVLCLSDEHNRTFNKPNH